MSEDTMTESEAYRAIRGVYSSDRAAGTVLADACYLGPARLPDGRMLRYADGSFAIEAGHVTESPAAAPDRTEDRCTAERAALADRAQGLYGAGVHPAGNQYGPADMTMYDRHR